MSDFNENSAFNWEKVSPEKFADLMAARIAQQHMATVRREDLHALRERWVEISFDLDDRYPEVYNALEDQIDVIDTLIVRLQESA